MAVLNADALREIENKLLTWKRKGHAPHGYPISEVTDLCDTITALKARKRDFSIWRKYAAKPLRKFSR